jgi:hypothetical protein
VGSLFFAEQMGWVDLVHFFPETIEAITLVESLTLNKPGMALGRGTTFQRARSFADYDAFASWGIYAV